MLDGKVLLGMAEMTEANRLKSRLAERDVTIEVVHNRQTCSTGCKITVELWADPGDLPVIQETMQSEWQRLMAGLDVDHDLLGQVFDPDAAAATCPACGTEFEPKLGECPDCGLVFALPDAEAKSCNKC